MTKGASKVLSTRRDPRSSRRRKNMLALLLGLMLAAAIVATMDIFLGKWLRASGPEIVIKKDLSGKFRFLDDDLGYRIEANIHGVASYGGRWSPNL